jgi:flavorubredoxin
MSSLGKDDVVLAQLTRYPQPPMGLSLIAAVLEKEGHKVTVLDANALRLQPEDVVSRVADADVVGLTIAEVPISCNWNSKISHLSILRDGFKTLKLLARKLIGDDLAKGTLNSILKQAGLKEAGTDV